MTIERSGSDQEALLLRRRIETVSWGLFFLWVGVAALVGVGWGPGLLGVGVIALGAQAFRRSRRLEVDRFGLMIGAFFVLAGILRLLDVRMDGGPVDLLLVLSVVVGIGLLASTLRRPRHT